MKKTKLTRPKLSRRNLIILGVVALVVLLAGGWYWRSQQNKQAPAAPTITTESGAVIDASPATDEEKQASEQTKENIVQQSQQSSNPSTTPSGNKKPVTPVITSASVSGVNAYVSGVFEEGGTCTFKFTLGQQSFSRTSSGFENATTTNCTPLVLSRSDFPSSGSWKVNLSYSSNSAEGTSAQASTIEVQ
jgi:cytoskeletal protein RodZ